MTARIRAVIDTTALFAVLLCACSPAEVEPEPTEPSPAPVIAPTPKATATTAPSASPTSPPSPQPKPQQSKPNLDAVKVELDEIATLTEPVAMADRPGDDALYIADRVGTVRALVGRRLLEPLVLDISSETQAAGEQGLLGIEYSDDGATLFVSYTDLSGDSNVDAYEMRGRRARPNTRRQVLFVEQPFANHNGGNLARGPDGAIYLGLGDGGGGGDPLEAAQDESTLLGKLVRVDDEPRIAALGLRNPWRFSFDQRTGDLWIGDVGQNAREEINRLPRRRLEEVVNYGWDIFEGFEPYEGGPEPDRYVPPVYDYPLDSGACSVVGGYVYRGRKIPNLSGAYLFSDHCDSRIRALGLDGREVVERDLGISASSVASFGEDAAGELYVLSLEGPVYRLIGG